MTDPLFLARFMNESNVIEGEMCIYENDVALAQQFTKSPITEKTVKELHLGLAKDRGEEDYEEWAGKWRACKVYVGNYEPPDPCHVPRLMNNFFRHIREKKFDSHTVHNEFEKIHPFRDLNGRVGRLIWLNLRLKETPDFHKYRAGHIPFLQDYYYQTLAKYEGK